MKRTDTRKLTTLAIFTALIIALQLISNVAKIGPVSITLSLVPIVVGVALYGVGAGVYLGGVFGAVVLMCCVIGMDPGGAILWNVNPLWCALVCLVKGMAAGAAAGAVYRAIAPLSTPVGAVFAGIAAPVVNTGLFILSMAVFFHQTLVAWAGGSDVVYYALVGLTGVNFLVELAVNMVLAPVIVRIIKARRPFAVPVRIVGDDTKDAQ